MSNNLIEELRRFDEREDLEDLYEDIEFIDTDEASEVLEELMGKKIEGITPIAKNAAGSLICKWNNLYVWIDSEFSPISVIASSDEELISLLLLGTGAIYDLVSAWENYKEYGGSHPLENERLTNASTLMADTREQHPAHDEFVSWAKSHGIVPPENPAKLIGDIIERYQSTFIEFLKASGIEI